MVPSPPPEPPDAAKARRAKRLTRHPRMRLAGERPSRNDLLGRVFRADGFACSGCSASTCRSSVGGRMLDFLHELVASQELKPTTYKDVLRNGYRSTAPRSGVSRATPQKSVSVPPSPAASTSGEPSIGRGGEKARSSSGSCSRARNE